MRGGGEEEEEESGVEERNVEVAEGIDEDYGV